MPTFDKRTLKRNIHQDKISQKEYEAFLSKLPDESNNFEEVSFEALLSDEKENPTLEIASEESQETVSENII